MEYALTLVDIKKVYKGFKSKMKDGFVVPEACEALGIKNDWDHYFTPSIAIEMFYVYLLIKLKEKK